MSPGQGRPEEILAWLRLARSEGVGARTFAALVSRHGTAVEALRALPEMARRAGREGPVAIASPQSAETELKAAAAVGARLVRSCDDDYPALLAATDDPPPLFWTLGDVARLHAPAVAMVGARIASAAGRRFARELAAGLGEAGLVVVSGLARGIDAAAHEGALASGTVAVLAGGVDAPYPPENLNLYQRICERGCVVSERPMGHQARAADFPRRNRIISGLARGVVVVEAELRSGSLITARLAAEQGREVMAVPGSPLEPRARGTNDLIRQGAALVESAEDVLAILADPARPAPRRSAQAGPELAEVGPDLTDVLDSLVSTTPVSLDELTRACGAPVAAVSAALMELSMAGRVELLPGGGAVRA